ncbi:MAG TPA: hypothetical protein VHT01_05300 [Candidatus Udaeobacter sp.]|nr:hypothetical protein [Candidatus Udaeobacter sp.]
MKALILVSVLFLFNCVMLRAEESAVRSNSDILKGYEIGAKSVSPNGRFAILYPIRGDDSIELPPNLLVCLKPYSVLTQIGTEGGRWQGRATNRWRSGTATRWSRSGSRAMGM